MPDLLHQGGLTMAIKKPVRTPGGGTQHLVLPAFSFATNTATAAALAQMIVDAWANGPFAGGGVAVPNLGDALLQRHPHTLLPTPLAIQTATARANAAGLNLTHAVVITEAEHDNDYIMQSGDEIVFVLPDSDRATTVPAGSLLATAEFLMACTPNGI
jgi:hypothetical protein